MKRRTFAGYSINDANFYIYWVNSEFLVNSRIGCNIGVTSIGKNLGVKVFSRYYIFRVASQ